MIYAIIIIIVCFVVSLLLYINIKKHKNDSIIYNEEKTKQLLLLDIDISKKNNEYDNLIRSVNNKQAELTQLEKDITNRNELNKTLIKTQEENLELLIQKEKTMKEEQIAKEIEDWTISAQEAANFNLRQLTNEYNTKLDILKNDIIIASKTVEDYKNKQAVINADIERRKKIEEHQEFFQVRISDESKHDLELLKEIKARLIKVDFLDKLIYDNYIKKSVDDMIKRVLNNNAISGIYKITRLKTGEIYIGKSTDIKARWQQHCKSCYHCGTISHSNLHTTMEGDGIWNWTFEVLEEVPKDKLTEREKYWITFYNSKEYGLNERVG